MAYPTLNRNLVYSTLFNQIISLQTMADNFKGGYSELKNLFREDGGITGDTKVYVSAEILGSKEWGGDAEAANLLAVERPVAPQTQEIVVDKYRIIALTLGRYIEAKAFMNEGQLSEFNSVMQDMVGQTKAAYEDGIVNTFVGTTENTDAATHSVSVTLSTATGVEKNRLDAGIIAAQIADLIVDMKDRTRKYNAYGFLRSYAPEDLMVVWNAEYANKIRKQDFSVLPNAYAQGGLIEKFEEHVLPARYFGTVNASATAAGTGVRSLVERDFNAVSRSSTSYDPALHVFPGDLIPTGKTANAGESYTEDSTVICKIMSKKAIKYLSSFETRSDFYNPRSLTTTTFLVWGFALPALLKDAACVTLKIAQ